MPEPLGAGNFLWRQALARRCHERIGLIEVYCPDFHILPGGSAGAKGRGMEAFGNHSGGNALPAFSLAGGQKEAISPVPCADSPVAPGEVVVILPRPMGAVC
jgi:hypothetical protein